MIAYFEIKKKTLYHFRKELRKWLFSIGFGVPMYIVFWTNQRAFRKQLYFNIDFKVFNSK